MEKQQAKNKTYPDEEFVNEHDIELVGFDTLLARSDFLSIHCPLNDETRGKFDRAAFAKMKRHCVLINTARGAIVVESELIAALQSGHLRGAGLDCFEQEPPSTGNPLFRMEQLVCTPHIAGNDKKSQDDMGIEAADCIIKLYSDEWPAAAIVNSELQDSWKW